MEEQSAEPQSTEHSVKSPTKKKWWKYFFEFLMIFFAVTLGFFVDNLREELSERNLESQHIQSLLSDLRQDTAMFRSQIRIQRQVIMMCDSVVLLAGMKERSAHDQQRLYFLTRRMTPRISPDFVNDRAFEEMRSSGALRLIHRKNIADSISKYYFYSKELLWLNNLVLNRAQWKIEIEAKVFSALVFDAMVDKKTLAFMPPSGNPPLATNDPKVINEFAVTIHFISSVCVYKKNYLTRLTRDANRLLATLQTEYPDLK